MHATFPCTRNAACGSDAWVALPFVGGSNCTCRPSYGVTYGFVQPPSRHWTPRLWQVSDVLPSTSFCQDVGLVQHARRACGMPRAYALVSHLHPSTFDPRQRSVGSANPPLAPPPRRCEPWISQRTWVAWRVSERRNRPMETQERTHVVQRWWRRVDTPGMRGERRWRKAEEDVTMQRVPCVVGLRRKGRSWPAHVSTGWLECTVPSLVFAVVRTRPRDGFETASLHCRFDRNASLQGTNEHDRTTSREAFLDRSLFRRMRTLPNTFPSTTSTSSTFLSIGMRSSARRRALLSTLSPRSTAIASVHVRETFRLHREDDRWFERMERKA